MELSEGRLAELAEWFFNPEASAPEGVRGNKVDIASQCFDQLFLKAPETTPDPNAIKAFRKMIQDQFHTSSTDMLSYNIPYPKYEFLRYLSHYDDYVFHGSKNSDMSMLEPKEQIDWNGNPLQAVFATRDVI